MAPFNVNGNPINSPSVIKDLGDFSAIQIPAKCAARIGQAFSQTLSAVKISDSKATRVPDVERNGRTFSDGCGTCSQETMFKIWEGYTEIQHQTVRPTIFQIRYKGTHVAFIFALANLAHCRGQRSYITRYTPARRTDVPSPIHDQIRRLSRRRCRDLWIGPQTHGHDVESTNHQDSRRPGCPRRPVS